MGNTVIISCLSVPEAGCIPAQVVYDGQIARQEGILLHVMELLCCFYPIKKVVNAFLEIILFIDSKDSKVAAAGGDSPYIILLNGKFKGLVQIFGTGRSVIEKERVLTNHYVGVKQIILIARVCCDLLDSFSCLQSLP